jgi:hypothetical protein
MKEILIATTSMFIVSVTVPKDTTKPVLQQKKVSKKTEKKTGEADESTFSLFNYTFKFQ